MKTEELNGKEMECEVSCDSKVICTREYFAKSQVCKKVEPKKQKKEAFHNSTSLVHKFSTKILRTMISQRTWLIAPNKVINCRTLDLRKSDINKVPENIVRLNTLEAIRLDGNTSFNDVTFLGKLEKLCVAVIKHCDITRFSNTSLTNSNSLMALELSTNPKLVSYADLSLLKRLRYLNIGRCNITSIPTEILELKKLRVLALDDNPLQEPIVDLSSLTGLQVLLMKNCNLTEIPSHVYRLENLMYLSIELNRINKVPSDILSLSKLVVLSIYGNRNILLTQKVTRCPELQRVNVDSNFCCVSPSKRLNKLIKVWKEAPCAWWKQL